MCEVCSGAASTVRSPVIRPHRSATYVRRCSLLLQTGVVQSVSLSVCHDRKLCKNGFTDRDAGWGMDLGGPKEACVR